MPTALGPSAPPLLGGFGQFASASPFLGSAAATSEEGSKHDEVHQNEPPVEVVPDFYEPWPIRHARKMGCIVRDFAYEDGRLPPVRPVWLQQHQPIGPESQGQQILTVMRPKTPQVSIATPTLTPNGSFIWANPEDEALAASQQQATHERVQTALAKLQAQAADAATSSTSPSAAPTTAPIPSTSSKPPLATPTTPLVMRVSVVLVSHSAKAKQKGRAPDYLPDARPLKRIRSTTTTDEPPLRTRIRGKSTVVPPSSRVLRSHVRSATTASTNTVPRNTRISRQPPAPSRSRARRS